MFGFEKMHSRLYDIRRNKKRYDQDQSRAECNVICRKRYEYSKGMLEREGKRGNQNKKHSREIGRAHV